MTKLEKKIEEAITKWLGKTEFRTMYDYTDLKIGAQIGYDLAMTETLENIDKLKEKS